MIFSTPPARRAFVLRGGRSAGFRSCRVGLQRRGILFIQHHTDAADVVEQRRMGQTREKREFYLVGQQQIIQLVINPRQQCVIQLTAAERQVYV